MLLRSYQVQAITACNNCFGNKKSCLVSIPTGTGKTQIICELIKQQQIKCLVIVHRDEIVQQISRTLVSLNITTAILSGTEQTYLDQHCCVASVQYLNLHPELLNQFEFLAIDEAHHAVASTYQRIIKNFKNRNCNIVGFTATIARSDEIGLVNAFEELAFFKPIKWFVENNFLSPIESYKIECDIDTSRLKISKETDDYILNDSLFAVLNASNWLKKCTETFLEHAKNLKTIAFCASIEHSKQLVESLFKEGVKAVHLDYKTPKKERDEILIDFRSGKIQVLSNISILTEGFDLPEIECVMFCRPTNSQLFYIQAIGRALRIHKDKQKALVLDFTDKNHTLFQLADLSGESKQIELLKNIISKNKINGFNNEFFESVFLSLQQRRHILHFAGNSVYKQFYNLLAHPKLAWASINENAVLEVSENQAILVLKNSFIDKLENPGLMFRLQSYKKSDLYTILHIDLAQETIKILGCCNASDSIEISSEYALNFATKIADATSRWRNDPPSKAQLDKLLEFGLDLIKIAGASKGNCSSLIAYFKICKIIGLKYV